MREKPSHNEVKNWKKFVSSEKPGIFFKINFQNEIEIRVIKIGRIRYQIILKNNANHNHPCDHDRIKKIIVKENNCNKNNKNIFHQEKAICFLSAI